MIQLDFIKDGVVMYSTLEYEPSIDIEYSNGVVTDVGKDENVELTTEGFAFDSDIIVGTNKLLTNGSYSNENISVEAHEYNGEIFETNIQVQDGKAYFAILPEYTCYDKSYHFYCDNQEIGYFDENMTWHLVE